MKRKYAAAELRRLALASRVPGSLCEIRAFAAHHETTVGADNHIALVEAFLLQLAGEEQHGDGGDCRVGGGGEGDGGGRVHC